MTLGNSESSMTKNSPRMPMLRNRRLCVNFETTGSDQVRFGILFKKRKKRKHAKKREKDNCNGSECSIAGKNRRGWRKYLNEKKKRPDDSIRPRSCLCFRVRKKLTTFTWRCSVDNQRSCWWKRLWSNVVDALFIPAGSLISLVVARLISVGTPTQLSSLSVYSFILALSVLFLALFSLSFRFVAGLWFQENRALDALISKFVTSRMPMCAPCSGLSSLRHLKRMKRGGMCCRNGRLKYLTNARKIRRFRTIFVSLTLLVIRLIVDGLISLLQHCCTIFSFNAFQFISFFYYLFIILIFSTIYCRNKLL